MEDSELATIRRELATIREQMGKVVFFINEAQAEIPEKVRRFVTYMHDIHDITYMYQEVGTEVPQYIFRELERCHDRFRQILEKAHSEGGEFAKVRAEMAEDPFNRYDHRRLLDKPTNGGQA
jgi:uncharacterized protein YydD (DUF2326 family)